MGEVDWDLMAPRYGWDLHCHTVFSDGTCSVRALIEEASRRGLHGVAITDHDTAQGWDCASREAVARGMPVVRGTEITAEDDGVSVHMLAFQYDPCSPGITALFARTRRLREQRAKRMVAAIARDYPIGWDDVLAQVREGGRTTIGRPHIADALVAAGVYASRSAAFEGIVGASGAYYLPTPSPDTHEVLAAVKEAGGVCVVAHAGDARRNRRLLSDAQIETLVDEGLDGVEVWHRGHDEVQRRRLLALATRHGLLVTGGSDWHGEGKPNALGECLTDDETVRHIVERGRIALAGLSAPKV